MKNRISIYIIVAISFIVGILHFIIGPEYEGPYKLFVTGYLMDILLPFNLYLLLQVSFRKKTTVLMSRIFGATFTILFAVWVEFLQFKGYSILGNTYDSLDILMYIIGAIFGFIFDILVLNRFENAK